MPLGEESRARRPSTVEAPAPAHELARASLLASGLSDGRDAPGAHLDHAVGEGRRVFAVVRDVDHRDRQFASQSTKFRAQGGPQFRIETGERLVEQENARPTDQRPGQRRSLLLAAGQLVGKPPGEVPDLNQAQRLLRAESAFREWHARGTEDEVEILETRQVRPQREILEHEPYAPSVWGDERAARLRDRRVKDGDGAGIWRLEARDQAQQRRLAGPARAEDHDRFADGTSSDTSSSAGWDPSRFDTCRMASAEELTTPPGGRGERRARPAGPGRRWPAAAPEWPPTRLAHWQ